MSNSPYIRISSEDKTAQSASNSDFQVFLEDKNSTQNIQTLTPIQVYCPNIFYNIRSSYGVVNNVLSFQENGQAVINVPIAEGQYTSSQLITAIETAVNAVATATVLAITLDPITAKFTFTFTGATAILFFPASSIAEAIGLTQTTADQNIHVMDEILNLNGITAVYIHSKQINAGGFIDGNHGSIACFTWLSLSETPFGGVASREISEASLNTITYQGKKNLSLISIVLRDSEGNKLPIGSQRLTIIFRATY